MIETAAQFEARTIEAWLTAARQRESAYVGPMPPRLVAATAQTMARCLEMPPPVAEQAALTLPLWQVFFPAVLGSDPANFTEVRTRLPHSFEIVRAGVARVADHPQAVFTAFHMTGFPLLAALLPPAVLAVHGQRGHVLVAQRNKAWLQTEAGRWIQECADVIWTDGRGLRQLYAGLQDGAIRRLLILVDGPHRPGPGTHALTGVSPILGFKTGLLRRLLAMHIPVVPLTHVWCDDRLQIEWQPLLPDDPIAGVETTAGLIEGLLRHHPEQWLNWSAARSL